MEADHLFIAIAAGSATGLVVGIPVVYFVTKAGIQAGLKAAFQAVDTLRGEFDKHVASPGHTHTLEAVNVLRGIIRQHEDSAGHPYAVEAVKVLRYELDEHKADSRNRWSNDERRWATEHQRINTLENRVTGLEKDRDEAGEPT